MKYRCYWCEEIFDEPSEHTDHNFCGPEIGYEDYTTLVCPYCGSEDIEEYDPELEEEEDDDESGENSEPCK